MKGIKSCWKASINFPKALILFDFSSTKGIPLLTTKEGLIENFAWNFNFLHSRIAMQQIRQTQRHCNADKYSVAVAMDMMRSRFEEEERILLKIILFLVKSQVEREQFVWIFVFVLLWFIGMREGLAAGAVIGEMLQDFNRDPVYTEQRIFTIAINIHLTTKSPTDYWLWQHPQRKYMVLWP